MVYFVVAVCVKVEKIGGMAACGAVVVKVSSGWICGAVERVRG